MVRCKFKCVEKREFIGWMGQSKLYGFKFSPVTDGSEENKTFYAATPGGGLDISTITQDAFEVGKEYYIDLTDATPVAAPGEATAP